MNTGYQVPIFWVYSEKIPSFPVIVKPISEGSSIGVEILSTEQDYTVWNATQTQAHQYFFESYSEGQNITVGVIEKEGLPIALPILECRAKRAFYDYTAKYTEGQTEFIVPAELSEELTKKAQQYAVDLHQACGCKGLSRTDMIVDNEKGILVLEINTIPGLTNLSDLPAQAKAANINFDSLVEIILTSAL